MIRFFEEYMGSYNPFEDRGCDEQRILRNSLYAVLPKIVKNELTQKQRLCFEMFYIDKKNQKEIASILGISLQKVYYHINKAINLLSYELKDYLPLMIFLLYHC